MELTFIVGYSGHSYVVLDLLMANGITCDAYSDMEEKVNNPFFLKYLGGEQDVLVAEKFVNAKAYLGIGNNQIREKGYSFLKHYSVTFPLAVHPSAIISSSSIIGDGTTVMAGSIINTFTTIGQGTICNTGSIVEHECKIGNFVHLAPGSVLAGNVIVDDFSFVGANAVIRQGVKIGKHVTIGAGAVVLKDVEDYSIVYGNPSKKRI